MRWRSGYAAIATVLLAVEIAIALFCDDAVVRPYTGDTLAVVLVYAALRTVSPSQWRANLAIALLLAALIETGQYAGWLASTGLADRAWARMMFGSSFDPVDLLRYVAGGACVWIVEHRRLAEARVID